MHFLHSVLNNSFLLMRDISSCISSAALVAARHTLSLSASVVHHRNGATSTSSTILRACSAQHLLHNIGSCSLPDSFLLRTLLALCSISLSHVALALSLSPFFVLLSFSLFFALAQRSSLLSLLALPEHLSLFIIIIIIIIFFFLLPPLPSPPTGVHLLLPPLFLSLSLLPPGASINENPRSNIAWEERLTWFKSSPEYTTLDRIDGEPIEFEWNIFPGFTTLQLSHKVQKLLLRLSETPENFTGRFIFMSMFNDISWGSKDNKKECESNANLVSLFAKRFGEGQWSFLGPGSEKKWYSISEDSPQRGHPVFRAMSPLSRGQLKSKGGGKLSIHYSADLETIKTVFRTIISVNQLSVYGAVAETCEEYETFHDRTGQPVVGGQSRSSFVPSVIKTEALMDCDDLARKDLLLKHYGERIKMLSQQDKFEQILYGCRIPECC